MADMPTFKARLDGVVYEVRVCWSQERVDAVVALYPDGVIDCDDMIGTPLSSHLEREWFKGIVRNLARSPNAKKIAVVAPPAPPAPVTPPADPPSP